ncbi:single Ig IL-1-related receptor [Corythoichthys intestinalis]|uniref:single Ig IL-1-related receptor n=1 Tax=Corythoichthys intestinalis TaxID=161448 RepID=UPI0025A61229|nr:single Ig IL-1-related receptor [Corythoichthys intestinalis]XP_061812907.1 single Ig IL-1-related receptor-like [Nerophis lumbriciformis]
MAAIFVAFTLVSSSWWSTSGLAHGQECTDAARFEERTLYTGQQNPPYRLSCSFPQTSGDPQPKPTWLKDCQPLGAQQGNSYLEFANISLEDGGNYTCFQPGNSTALFTVRLIVKASKCSRAPEFQLNEVTRKVWAKMGSTVNLNCTALLSWDPSDKQCDSSLQWTKDGHPVNHSLLLQNNSSWFLAGGELMMSSVLVVHLKALEDFGMYICSLRNSSSAYNLLRSNSPSHTAAVTAAFIILLLLAIAAVIYTKCHLNIKLWYRNTYGDYEINDGKLYDAYISYVNNDYDRKFINFILKPHLENKQAQKVHLNDNDILPGLEPSDELLMNISRSRRLIVLLSHAYLEQDWCSNDFRRGLLHLLELCRQPIVIMLDGQLKRMRPEIKQQLTEHQHCLTILTWRQNSVTPSSTFWKELALAMPRRMVFHSEAAGDPQMVLHDDKDPMLTLDPDYLDCRSDTDPAGDLGVRLPVYKAMTSKAPVLPVISSNVREPRNLDLDVSDLETRQYGARSDFYCLVTKEDI